MNWVRRYAYSVPDGKFIQKHDIHGLVKVIRYRKDGQADVEKPEEFIEEKDQFAHMPVPAKRTEAKPAQESKGESDHRHTEE